MLDQTKGGSGRLPRVGRSRSRRRSAASRARRFDPAEMQKIVALARREGIRLHLDGARLFLEAAYTGENVADVARPFDTVYVSLYKYFNAASGAILAGPRELLDGMYHARRMFGGGLITCGRSRRRAPLSRRLQRPLQSGGSGVRGLDSRAPAARRASRSTASRWARTCSGFGPRDGSGRVPEAARRRAACCCRAAARHVPDRRERDAEPHDGAGLTDAFVRALAEAERRKTSGERRSLG